MNLPVRIGLLLSYLLKIEAVWRLYYRHQLNDVERSAAINSIWVNEIMKSGLTDDEMEILAEGSQIVVKRAQELVSKETLGNEALMKLLRDTPTWERLSKDLKQQRLVAAS